MEPDPVNRCLAHLRRLPFVEQATAMADPEYAPGRKADLVLRLRTPAGDHEFAVEVKKPQITQAVAEHHALEVREPGARPWMLFAPFVPPRVGRALVERGLCYIDEVGNCHVAIGREYVARIEGRRRPQRTPRGRGMGIAGYKVLFTILADPEVLHHPVRKIAELADVGKTAVAHTLQRLEEERLIARGADRRHLLRVRPILDRWLVGYENLVRPRLLVGRFHTPHAPEELEKRLAELFGPDAEWGFGGGAAAMRLTGYYRGEDTLIHATRIPGDFRARLRALPARDGKLLLLLGPGGVALQGQAPHTVHPLLVYTELINAGDERARETAGLVREQFLQDLG